MQKVNGSHAMLTTEQLTQVTATFQPMWDYVLIEVLPKEQGVIALPDRSSMDDMLRARVVAAGPGMYRDSGAFIKNPINVGDEIYCISLSKPFTVQLCGKTLLCIASRDVVATRNKASQHVRPEELASSGY